ADEPVAFAQRDALGFGHPTRTLDDALELLEGGLTRLAGGRFTFGLPCGKDLADGFETGHQFGGRGAGTVENRGEAACVAVERLPCCFSTGGVVSRHQAFGFGHASLEGSAGLV